MKYKLFNLIDDGINHGLFKLKVGGDRTKLVDDVYSKRKVNIISNTTSNNGVESFIFNDNEGIKNCITIATRGNDYYASYQDDYTITIVRTLLLYTDKFELNKYIGFYICALIRKNKYKSAYGRVLSGERLKHEKILLPIDDNENPNWRYIEEITKKIYIKTYSKFSIQPVIEKKIKLEVDKWESFIIGKLFKVTLGSPIHGLEIEEIVAEKSDKNIPYVTRTATNNGVELFVENNVSIEDKINLANCITVGAEGFKAFFQPLNFINGNKINIIRHSKLNKYVALFISTLLNLEIEKKFNYGRGATKERISQLKIKLPSKKGNPDFEFMENYIKSLSYSSSL